VASVTFDDGYHSVFANALPLLLKYDVPATIYLITGVVGTGQLVWVNELNWYLVHFSDQATLLVERHFPAATLASSKDAVSFVRQHFDSAKVAELLEDLRSRFGSAERPDPLYVSWEDVATMAAAGVGFGCHTVSHPSLPALADSEQMLEIRQSRRAVVERLGTCDSFSYPFGDVDDRARRNALSEGFSTLMEVADGGTAFHPLRISRVPIADSSVAALFAEVELVAPLKARLRSLRRGHESALPSNRRMAPATRPSASEER
jgi:peptidoglycan/xylan/chitin deacetylase (PgdA/CDA1 family)